MFKKNVFAFDFMLRINQMKPIISVDMLIRHQYFFLICALKINHAVCGIDFIARKETYFPGCLQQTVNSYFKVCILNLLALVFFYY
jgi:hypothetical protein